MFGKITKTAALAALIGVSSMAVTAGQAAAGGSVGFSVEFGSPGYGQGWGPSWGPVWGPGYGPKPQRGICKPRRAVKKAWKMGVRNGRIVRRNNKRVVVRGWRYGYRVKVVFANRRHCPVVALR